MRYEWRGPGSRRDISAEAAATELKRIYKAKGDLKPAAVVEESRPKTAPLHPVFEWNDKLAAAAHRTEQARQVIRAIHVVPEATDPNTFVIRGFYNVAKPGESDRTYKSVEEAIQNPADRAAIMKRFTSELLGLRQRYQDLMEYDKTINGTLESLIAAADPAQ